MRRRFVEVGAVLLGCLLLGPTAANANCPPGVELPDYCTIGYVNVVLQDNPLAYWRLGDALDTSVMSDETGNHPGTYKNGAGGSPQLGISGDEDTAAYFVGEGQYGYVNDIEAPQSAYSMEAWVLASDDDASMIMQHGGSGALFIDGSGRYAFAPDSNEVGLRVVDEEPGDALPSGGATAFHHVVGTWTKSTARLYVDGRLVDKETSNKPPSGSATFYIGYGTIAPWVRGFIDEAAYYNHALSADRIAAHYYADPPPPLWVPRGARTQATATRKASGPRGGGHRTKSHRRHHRDGQRRHARHCKKHRRHCQKHHGKRCQKHHRGHCQKRHGKRGSRHHRHGHHR